MGKDFRRAAVERWLVKAGNDLKTAQTMLETDPPITDAVCFHAQQCAEKSFKAFLTFRDVHVEKTHYLPRLLELCRDTDSTFDDLRESAISLTDYAVEIRYPDDWRDIPVDEAAKAVQNAEKIMASIQRKLS